MAANCWRNYIQTDRDRGGISRTSAKYDYLGNVLSSEESHAAGPAATADRIRKTYTYDNQGRVATETASLPGRGAATTLFSYDIFGRLTNCGYQGEEYLYGLWEDLSYDIRGRLLSKEAFRIAPLGNPSGGIPGGEEDEEPEEPEEDETQSVFSQYLRYHSPLKAASQRRWNGLISEIAHQRTDTGTVITNGYFYDHAGRLTDHIRYDGISQTNKYTERDLSFDRNGNILSLKRFGTNVAAPQDNLAYTYEGNKLMQLNGATYQYDSNGNMTHDGRRGLDLSWNHLNLPSSICSDEDEDALVNYTYLTDGTKVITQQPATGEGYAYLGTATYKLVNNVWTLESVPFTGGRFIANATGGMDEYRYITDHLGSTRVIVTGTDYHEVEHNDYYPFGKRIADNTLPTTQNNRWRFSGKEMQTIGGINLIDFGARLYDDFSGRWKTQDALTEKYLSLSPYGYCAENPISLVDQEGERIVFAEDASQSFKNAFAATVKYMNAQKTSDNLAKLEKSSTVYILKETDSEHPISSFVAKNNTQTIYWSPSQILETEDFIWLSPATILDHEAAHAARYDTDYLNSNNPATKQAYLNDHVIGSSSNYGNKEEERVISNREQRTARRHKEIRDDQVTRSGHSKVRVVSNVDASSFTPLDLSKIIGEHNDAF